MSVYFASVLYALSASFKTAWPKVAEYL